MNDKEIEIRIDKLVGILTSLNGIQGPMAQVREYFIRVGGFIKDTYKDGYDKGFEEGKIAWANYIKTKKLN